MFDCCSAAFKAASLRFFSSGFLEFGSYLIVFGSFVGKLKASGSEGFLLLHQIQIKEESLKSLFSNAPLQHRAGFLSFLSSSICLSPAGVQRFGLSTLFHV